jgi:hypothetical protein
MDKIVAKYVHFRKTGKDLNDKMINCKEIKLT